MKKIKFLVYLFMVSLALTGCDPNDNDGSNHNDDAFAENFGNSASRNFMGQIVDTSNQPIQNVSVKIGSTTAQTDSNGVFIIDGASVYEKFAYITAKKAGYLDGSRAIVPTVGRNNIRIMMLPAVPTTSIASGDISEVALPSGTKVVFDGDFEDENGNAYHGNINVYAFHLKPSDNNLSSLMPGMLYAADENGNEKILETFGMLNVELRGTGGQKLQIAGGHTAEISVKIDDSQMGTAPSSIPLWHFDAENGYWKQEGSATKQGNFYVGDVSHFSWWNCDAQFPTINLCTKVVDANGNPVTNAWVEIVRSNYSSASGITDDEGNICGLVPANETFTIKVHSYLCNEVIHTQVAGPFSTDTALPNIVISNSVQSILVEGSLVQCDNSDVTNGYVTLSYGNGTQLALVNNGDFSFNVITCETDGNFTLRGYDYESLQQTDSISYTFTAPVTNVGNLAACNAVTEFISYQIDSNPVRYIIGNVGGGGDPNGTNPEESAFSVYGYIEQQISLNIWNESNDLGSYTTSTFSIEGSEVYIWSGITNDVVLTISNYGAVGEYIDATFVGTYTIDGVTHTITGVAHAKRDY